MKMRRFRPAAIAAAATFALCGGAQGQQQRLVPVGSFVVSVAIDPSTGQERSIVLLAPTPARPDTAGELLWGCAETSGTLVFAIRPPPTANSSETQDMVWTFDADAPRTAGIRSLLLNGLWGPAAEASAVLTQRARTAARLVIRLPHAPAGQDAVYEYDLAGADSALGRLACARNPRPVQEAANTFPAPARPDDSSPPDVRTYELARVEELPRPTNTADFNRALMAGYPRSLRQARVTGTVHVRFRVMEDGRVDPGSITITRPDHELFSDPTIRAVRVLRFRPAKVGGRPVKVWVEIPVRWTPPR